MRKSKKSASEPALGYEAKLWQMADVLQGHGQCDADNQLFAPATSSTN